MLYKKALEAKKISGSASYYAAEAREAGRLLKAKQRERQMELFTEANAHKSRNQLDLHFLTTAEAIKELSHFISYREASLR